MSIKKTLRITLIIFSIVPIIMVSILAYHLIANRLIAVKEDNLLQLAQTNSNGLKALVKNQQTEVNLLAIQNQLYNLAFSSQHVTTSESQHYQAIYKSAVKLLSDRKQLYPSCERITLYNIEKIAIASSDESIIGTSYSNSLTLSYINATKSTASGISGLQENKEDETPHSYSIEVGCPIVNESSQETPIIGYIVSTINITHFKEFLNSIVMGKTGFGIVLDKQGNVVYHPSFRMVGTKLDSDKLRNLVSNYYKGVISQSGTFKYNYNGVNTLYGYSVIPDLDWVLLVKQDVAEIIKLANINLYVLGWSILILLLLLIIVSNSITKAYTNPIIELKDVMQIASEGNLSVQSTITSRNEFGELSKSFNKMLHIIKNNYNELTAIHEVLMTNEEELRENYNHIEYLAYHDILTNLPNKLSFVERVNGTLATSLDRKRQHAVYFVDLDNFKTINDTLGHDYGDNLLTQTAAQLVSLTSSNDILARAGGDEFLIFKSNIKSKEAAIQFAVSIIDAFKNPFDLSGEVAYISLSIGIAIYPINGDSTNILIKNADIAMYKSKDTGKNKYTLFDSSMEAELNRNTLILEVLRHAIKNNEIYVTYQPQFTIKNNNLIGFEALMRIRNEKLGNISPNEFIPIAEDSGLIVELGGWILRKACEFNMQLIHEGYGPYIVSVNISTIQINRSGFITMIDKVLKETGLPPKFLELEITESTIVSSLMDATVLLNNLLALGVRISLDDFGTGYSSLNYLTSMPIHTLKIDKSFVNNISKNKKDSYIAEAIIQLAHSIDVEVIAEGVEFNDQLEILKSKKCDIVQGFIFSKPLLPSELLDLLKKKC